LKCSSLNEVNTETGSGKIDLPTQPVKVNKLQMVKIPINPINDKTKEFLKIDFFTDEIFKNVEKGFIG
jgi:hypothetical protein